MLTYVNPGGSSIDDFYVYPYYLTLGSEFAVPITMMCDDFADDIVQNEQWLASAHAMSQTNLLNGAFIYSNSESYGGGNTTLAANAVEAYKEAGHIFTGMTLGAIDSAQGNLAVWYLFSPVAVHNHNTSFDLTPEKTILDQAYNWVTDPAHSNYDYSYITVYSPQPNGIISPPGMSGRGQEFFAMTASYGANGAVPEPPPSLLLAAGGALIGLVGLARRKRLSRA